MKLAIASGKGGTGKTSLAVSLALTAAGPVHYVDCDVEEPNGHIFLHPQFTRRQEITLPVPELFANACTGCGACRDICRFNAITVIGKRAMLFPELCHACGGCYLVCQEQALNKGRRLLGLLEEGQAGAIRCSRGTLRVGEAMAVPLIAATKQCAADFPGLVILDAPPGTSCPLVATIRETDYVLLVTEESPFGLHDLRLAVEVVGKMGLPFGVVINRADLGDGRTSRWCESNGIRIHLTIPFDRAIAAGYAAGEPMITSLPALRDDMARLLGEITA